MEQREGHERGRKEANLDLPLPASIASCMTRHNSIIKSNAAQEARPRGMKRYFVLPVYACKEMKKGERK
jgi:hypothetical protein